MTAALITASVCFSYAAFGYLVIRTHDAERLTPRWLRRLGRQLRRVARAVRARVARAAAAVRLRYTLTSSSLHLLLTPKGVHR